MRPRDGGAGYGNECRVQVQVQVQVQIRAAEPEVPAGRNAPHERVGRTSPVCLRRAHRRQGSARQPRQEQADNQRRCRRRRGRVVAHRRAQVRGPGVCRAWKAGSALRVASRRRAGARCPSRLLRARHLPAILVDAGLYCVMTLRVAPTSPSRCPSLHRLSVSHAVSSHHGTAVLPHSFVPRTALATFFTRRRPPTGGFRRRWLHASLRPGR